MYSATTGGYNVHIQFSLKLKPSFLNNNLSKSICVSKLWGLREVRPKKIVIQHRGRWVPSDMYISCLCLCYRCAIDVQHIVWCNCCCAVVVFAIVALELLQQIFCSTIIVWQWCTVAVVHCCHYISLLPGCWNDGSSQKSKYKWQRSSRWYCSSAYIYLLSVNCVSCPKLHWSCSGNFERLLYPFGVGKGKELPSELI